MSAPYPSFHPLIGDPGKIHRTTGAGAGI
jgi:hypothetical protein